MKVRQLRTTAGVILCLLSAQVQSGEAQQAGNAQDAELHKELQTVLDKFRVLGETRALEKAGATNSQKAAALDVLKQTDEVVRQALAQQRLQRQGQFEKTRDVLRGILGQDKWLKFEQALYRDRREAFHAE